MYKIVLMRHGESVWNQKNLFTGWVDVDLAPAGVQEAVEAGDILKKEGYFPLQRTMHFSLTARTNRPSFLKPSRHSKLLKAHFNFERFYLQNLVL